MATNRRRPAPPSGRDGSGELEGSLRQEIREFLEHLRFNRNASDHTVRAYESDLGQFVTAVAAAQGRTRVRCVTSPVNEGSIAFHESLGFSAERVAADYDGPGEDRVLFVKQLEAH